MKKIEHLSQLKDAPLKGPERKALNELLSKPECPVTGGEHDWEEGGGRDRGRCHCRRCYQCLSPLSGVRDAATLRAIVIRLLQQVEVREKALSAWLGYAECVTDGMPESRLDKEFGKAVLATNQVYRGT
jgi:hypothetical protein